MNSSEIQKYAKSKTSTLKRKAIERFNAKIRARDEGQGCICCKRWPSEDNPIQCGHFYSAGKYNHMRFLEDNCHGQLMNCNYFKSGNLLEYRKNLIEKIGIDRVEKLDYLASIKTPQHDDRLFLIEIIEKYK